MITCGMRPAAFAGRTPESGGVVLANGDYGPAQIHVASLDNEINQVQSSKHPVTPGWGEFGGNMDRTSLAPRGAI